MDMGNFSMSMEPSMKEVGNCSIQSKWSMVKDSTKSLEICPALLDRKAIMAHGTKTKWKATEHINTPVEPPIKVNGKITNKTVKAYMSFLMELLMKENGKIT